MLLQELTIFILKTLNSMVLLLILYVLNQGGLTCFPRFKGPIPILPIEIRISFGLHPLGRTLLELLDEIAHRDRSAEAEECVNVVRCSAHSNHGALQMVENAAEIVVQFRPDCVINPWLPVLR